MAASYVGAGAFVSKASQTSISLKIPSGTQRADLLVAVITNYFTSNAPTSTGWTQISTSVDGSGSRTTVLYKWCITEESNYHTFQDNQGVEIAGVLLSFRGVSLSTTLSSALTLTNSDSLSSVTPTARQSMVVAIIAGRSSTGATSISGYHHTFAERVDSTTEIASDYRFVGVATISSGAAPIGAVTLSVAGGLISAQSGFLVLDGQPGNTTYFLDPWRDVYNTFSALGDLSVAYPRVKRRERFPDTPDTTTYLTPSVTATEQAILDVQTFVKPPIANVEAVDLLLYMSNDEDLTTEIQLYGNYVATTRYNDGAGFSAQWKVLRWSSGNIDQDEINNLRIRLKYAQGTPIAGSSRIYAAYLALYTTNAAITFDRPKDSYTLVPLKAWKPRIRPGAFWI